MENLIRPKSEVQALYNTRLKYYKDKIEVATFSKKIFNPNKLELVRELNKSRHIKKEEKRIRHDSMRRAKNKAFDICYSNEWQYFITFTLDKTKIDRYDIEIINKKLKQWLKDRVRRNNLKYIIFPERHQDGAIHFHGLCSGDLKLKDSGLLTKNNQKIYNAGAWTYGYSTAILLDSQTERIINYVIKYINKEQEKIFGNYYFAGGRGLVREVPTDYISTNFYEADGKLYDIPNTKMRVKYHTIFLKSNVSRETKK